MFASRLLLGRARVCLLAPRPSFSHSRALYTSKILTKNYQEPTPQSLHQHNHEKLWLAERYLSWALLGVLPAAWVIPHPLMDYAVATSLVVHVHWGVEAIVIDYIRPAIFGPVIPKVSIALVYVLSVLAASGLFIFNWTDVGMTQAFRMIARI